MWINAWFDTWILYLYKFENDGISIWSNVYINRYRRIFNYIINQYNNKLIISLLLLISIMALT
jgi:hypothetical protein